MGPDDEKRHTPGPSLWPVGFAVGVACVLVGLIVSWPAVAVGAAITLVFGFLWIRDVTRDQREEPAEEGEAKAEAAAAPAAEEPLPAYPRSKFLELTTLGLGGVITAIVTLPVLGFAVLPAFVDQDYDDIDLGPLDNFPEGQWIETTYLQNPAQGEVSRRTAYIRRNADIGDVPSLTIISNRCAHLGCPVQASGPRADEERTVETEVGTLTLTEVNPAGFGCPCHGGAYDNEGNRTAGPPVRSLDRFEFSIVGGRLILGEPYSVGNVEGEGAEAVVTRYPITGPGQHVDGLEQWLYPIVPSQVSS